MVHSDRISQNQESSGDGETNERTIKPESSSSASTSTALVRSSNVLAVKAEAEADFDDEVNHWHNIIIKASKQLVSRQITVGLKKYCQETISM